MASAWLATHHLARSRWYLNRLRCMTMAELPFRAVETVKRHAERWLGAAGAEAPVPDLRRLGSPWIRPSAGIAPERYVAAADRIAAGTIDVFAIRDVDLGSPPQWNRDPKTGTRAPLRFGMLLDYRDPRLVGDVKYLWEINRHAHLVTLAQAHALSGEPRYAHAIRRQLESWFDACPYPMGPNWSSALEAGIRLLNWSAAWHLLGGIDAALFAADGVTFRNRWLEAVYQHARFVRGHLSRHSSANNHLIGEAVGLYVAARTWPCWPPAEEWLEQAAKILARETLLQNAPDGVNREQAVSYQQFELDLLLIAHLAAAADGAGFGNDVLARLERMLEYLAAIMDAGGSVPRFGDSDDGFVVRLSQERDFCSFRSLLATGAVLFRRADFARKAGSIDHKTRWLLGEQAESAFRECAHGPRPRLRTAFSEGGYYILGCDFDTESEIRLVADAGALGYGTLAAHGHADALSFTLSVGGREFFIDPGTYTYRDDTPWRSYFRGTAAHNTIRIDGRDQSQQGGNFLWLRRARATCRHWYSSATRDEFEGVHDGYRRLADPVVHRRLITLDKTARRIVIEDVLEMSATHDVELYFHCSPDSRVERRADCYAVHHGRVVLLQLPHTVAASVRICNGETDPICGWTSPRFDVLRPSPTILWRARLTGSTVLRSVVGC